MIRQDHEQCVRIEPTGPQPVHHLTNRPISGGHGIPICLFEPLTVFGDGLQTRAFSYIDDVAPIIARSVEVPESANETFNIGADRPYTVIELAQEVGRAFDLEPTIRHLPPRKEVVHAFSTHDKVIRIFGSQKNISLTEGVSRMAKWAREHGSRRGQVFGSVEIMKNMPPSWKKDLLSS